MREKQKSPHDILVLRITYFKLKEAYEKGQMSKALRDSSFHTFLLGQDVLALSHSMLNKQTPYFIKGLNVDKTKYDQ